MFEHRKFQRAICFRNPNGPTEIADRFRSITTAPHAGERGHPRIIPTSDAFFLHQSEQLALAEQRVGKSEAIELNLLGWENAELLDEPVVERAMILKFERTDRVGDV